MRYPTSLVTSVPFMGNTIVRKLSEVTDASVSTHWPVNKHLGLKSWEGQRRWENQIFLDSLKKDIVVENHVRLGMSGDQTREWLDGGGGRHGFAFVSGRDVRDEEYGGESGVDPRMFLADTRGLYIKDGWSEEALKDDLRAVLDTNPDHNLWLLVNYLDGANTQTAEKLLSIVEKVQRR